MQFFVAIVSKKKKKKKAEQRQQQQQLIKEFLLTFTNPSMWSSYRQKMMTATKTPKHVST